MCYQAPSTPGKVIVVKDYPMHSEYEQAKPETYVELKDDSKIKSTTSGEQEK